MQLNEYPRQLADFPSLDWDKKHWCVCTSFFPQNMFLILLWVQQRWQHQKCYCSPEGLTAEWGTASSELGHKRKGDFKPNQLVHKTAPQTPVVAPSKGPRTTAQEQEPATTQQETPGAMTPREPPWDTRDGQLVPQSISSFLSTIRDLYTR